MPRSEPIKAARGVRDILPAAIPLWRQAEQGAAGVAQRFGYQEIATPIIEQLELIQRVGEDTDAVAKELYRVEKRGTQNLALRPEATAGVVRAYFEGGLNQGPQPARLYLIGPMFRYDRPQKGRYRQFFQFNVEAIGVGSPAVDVEVIELARSWLIEVGLDKLALELNTIGDDQCRPAYLDLLRTYYRPLKDKLHPDCQRRLEVNPLRLLDCKVPQCQPLKTGAPKITDHLCEPCASAWAVVLKLLDAAGIGYHLNPYLVRGLDYYTRTTYEAIATSGLGAQSTLAGGGRYDGLVKDLGGPDVPGIGFAAGVERLALLLAQEGKERATRPVVFIAPLGDAEAARADQLAQQLRAAGLATEVSFRKSNPGNQLKRADALGARFALVLGDQELKSDRAKLKELKTGAQHEVTLSGFADEVRKLTGGPR